MPLPMFQGSFEEPQRKQKLVDAVFDQVSHKYDLGNELLSLGTHQRLRNRLIEYARIERHHHVLDIACGTGDVSFLVSPLAAKVVGSDNNRSMLELARRKQPLHLTNIEFVEADAAALPFPDASFDRVIISYATRGLPPWRPSHASGSGCSAPAARSGTSTSPTAACACWPCAG